MTTTTDIIPDKWVLLPEDHPTVIRRLAKELNAHGWQAGRCFYVWVPGRSDCLGKFNCARIKAGQLQISMCRDQWVSVGYNSTFDDGNGNNIKASRTKCGH